MAGDFIFLDKSLTRFERWGELIKKRLILTEVVVIFLLTLIYSFKNLVISCKVYRDLSFDSQILLTWDYTSQIGILPYRDIYYPYGILSYSKNVDPIFLMIYLVLSPILFSAVFLGLMYLWRNRVFAYSSFLAFILFVVKISDLDNFSRYGIVASFGFIYAYFFSKKTYVDNIIIFFLSLVIGFIFSMVSDQGIYLIILFFALLFLNPIFQRDIQLFINKAFYLYLLKRLLVFSLGFFIGILPLCMYFIYHSMMTGFLSDLTHLTDFPLYAKTPFIPFSMSTDNMFTYGSVLIAGMFVSYKVLFDNKKLQYHTYVILLLTLLIFLLEQKSLIRSIDKQITFIAMLLYLTLFCEFYLVLSRLKVGTYRIFMYFLLLFIIILHKFPLHPFSIFENTNYNFKPVYFFLNTKEFLSEKSRVCLNSNMSNLQTNDSKYLQIADRIKQDRKDDLKVFSFLSDPIFYVLFNQKPPYYFSIFEATPSYSQNSNVLFLEKNRIDYVIYNKDITRLQDNVPDYARNGILFKHLVNNFRKSYVNKNFIVFKREDKSYDLFRDEAFGMIPDFKKYLLNIDLGAIPKSEGAKQNFDKTVLSIVDENTISSIFETKTYKSDGLFIILRPLKYSDNKKETMISIETEESLSTTLSFSRCKVGGKCVINIDNIPLFYIPRVIKKIKVDSSYEGGVELVKTYQDKYW